MRSRRLGLCKVVAKITKVFLGCDLISFLEIIKVVAKFIVVIVVNIAFVLRM